MLNKIKDIKYMDNIILSLIGFLIIYLGSYFAQVNRFFTGAIIILAAILLYFSNVLIVAKKNWLDIRAIFSGVWLGTIGLATLRLADYQKDWLDKTWLLLALAYLMFQIGSTIGINLGPKCIEIMDQIHKKMNKYLVFSFRENRLFYICTITTLISLCCFLINVYIKGFIPAFSNDTRAYVDFYTKFHVFAVAATAVSGLCYFCIKTQAICLFKKIILWVCIFYLVIIFPVLVVSRGVFIVASLSLSTVIFYLNNKKLFVFITCLVIISGIYLFTSNLRGYTNEQLQQIFRPSTITTGINKSEVDNSFEKNTESTNDYKENNILEESNNEKVNTFSLPPKVAFLYTYLTVSHDNFNEAIEKTVDYTWGIRQLKPFNVIVRNKKITQIIESAEFYQITVNFNTVNMVGLFYYDFHEWGVFICTFLWSLFFGIVQGIYQNKKGIFSLCILGLIVNSVTLSFFSSWVDNFEIWMFAGVILIVSIFSCVSKKHC